MKDSTSNNDIGYVPLKAMTVKLKTASKISEAVVFK